MTVPAASHDRGVSLPRRRTPLRSWVVLVLALLGALLALLLGAVKGAQSASASPLPDASTAVQRSTSQAGVAFGSTGIQGSDQWRSVTDGVSDGVTQPSPRVTPKTSVVGSMRRPDHGTPQVELAVSDALPAGAPVVGLVDLSVSAMPMLGLLFGGAIVVLRSNPARPRSVPTSR